MFINLFGGFLVHCVPNGCSQRIRPLGTKWTKKLFNPGEQPWKHGKLKQLFRKVPCTSHSKVCNYAEPKPFSWAKTPARFPFFFIQMQDHILSTAGDALRQGLPTPSIRSETPNVYKYVKVNVNVMACTSCDLHTSIVTTYWWRPEAYLSDFIEKEKHHER
jgi:hypothetical protein